MTTPPGPPPGAAGPMPGPAPGAPADGPDPTGTTQTQTPPPPPPPPGDGPRVSRDDVRDLARLRRTTGPHRNIAGVAGGLGRHLDIDPVILRVAFVVLAFFGGAGILLYGAIWLLVPDDSSTRSPLGLDERSRSVGLLLALGIATLTLLGSSLGDGFVPFPVVVVAGVALLVVVQLGRRRGAGAPPPSGGWVGHPSPPPPGGWVGQAPAPAGAAPEASYSVPGGPVTLTKTAPPAPGWTPPPVPIEPRKRGPILFWFTMALCALGVGVLGVLDLAGAPVAGPAYPALVVGVIGAMLVLGAFWGRAGGLILVGLLAVLALVGSLAAQEIDTDSLRVRPTTAAAVAPSYDLDTGDLVLDLRGVTDLAALDGRTVTLTNDVGRIEVIVPDGLQVSARASVDGPGHLDVFDSERGGIDQSLAGSSPDAADGAPVLTLDARIDVGEIEIHHAPGSRGDFLERTPR